MDINDIAGLHESIAQAMQGAFDKPRTSPQTYYPSEIPRARRESYLGDSTAGALPPIYPDPDDAPAPPSAQQADGGGSGGDIPAVMYLASEGALVNVTLKGTIDP